MYQYLVQLKGNGVEDCRIMTIKSLYALAIVKPERMEIFYVQFGQDPRRLRWGFDGVTLWLYDRFGNVFDSHSTKRED